MTVELGKLSLSWSERLMVRLRTPGSSFLARMTLRRSLYDIRKRNGRYVAVPAYGSTRRRT